MHAKIENLKWVVAPAVLVLNTAILIALVALVALRDGFPARRNPTGAGGARAPGTASGGESSGGRKPAVALVNGDLPVAAQKPPADGPAVSWAVAERAYAVGEYGAAMAQFRRLLATAETNPAEELVSDFFRLRIGQCQRRLSRPAEARQTFLGLATSRSPVVRGCALYQAAALSAAEEQYLTARLQAYQALASLGAVEAAAPLEAECEFLVATVLARKALAFFNQDRELPPAAAPDVDPLAGLKTEPGLRAVLAAGTDRLRAAALGPQVAMTEDPSGGRRWTVTSAGAPLEELLSRLAGPAGVNITWMDVGPAVRQRPIYLALTDSTDAHVIEVACGAVGLVARLSGTGAAIHDPSDRLSTDALRDLVMREAVSAWRRRLLTASDPDRHAYGHLALGMLVEHQGDKAAALAEYGLLVERYRRSALAPMARLRGAVVRMDFRDFAGAREELLELLNRDPNFPASDQVYLRLGQATMEAGLLDDAIKTFKKLFYLELSAASRSGACLGAGTAFWRKGDYQAASEWLTRYVKLAEAHPTEETARAAWLLARSHAALGHPGRAVQVLRDALLLEAAPPVWADLRLELARNLADDQQYTAAMAVLRRLAEGDLAPDKADEAVLLEARVLRAISLPEKALRLLRQELASASSPEMAARMAVELARCHADAGDLEGARRLLAEVLPKLQAGPLAQEAACQLAQVCLRAGHAAQAIGVCDELLKANLPSDLRRRALDTLGAAYVETRQYTRAALAFSGTVPDAKGGAGP
jgi:tetratricopeptide (TPR) repeat protein